MYLFVARLKTSLKTAPPVLPGLGSPISEPSDCALDHTNVPKKDRPFNRRFMAFNWSESYQLLPRGFQYTGIATGLGLKALGIPVNWGNGRKAWATVKLAGKPA